MLPNDMHEAYVMEKLKFSLERLGEFAKKLPVIWGGFEKSFKNDSMSPLLRKSPVVVLKVSG